MMLMGSRAAAAKKTLQTMQAQQNRMGVNMRSDIVNAQNRMEFHMDEAEAALKTGDATKAGKSLDSAERELEKLEKFLGL